MLILEPTIQFLDIDHIPINDGDVDITFDQIEPCPIDDHTTMGIEDPSILDEMNSDLQ